ncbi:hypothetical protein [Sulfuricurvum sp.]|uniref:hypothetical protein n=1 Tax=Sulfuricurvum sp. TaxID=2025608 RepID=UPI0035683B79
MTTFGNKKLNKKEKKHLKECGIVGKWMMEQQVKAMLEERKKSRDERVLCWECWTIAKKLGMVKEVCPECGCTWGDSSRECDACHSLVSPIFVEA